MKEITLTVTLTVADDIDDDEAAGAIWEILNDDLTKEYFLFRSWGDWSASVR